MLLSKLPIENTMIMHSELIAAIKERIALGHPKAVIRDELVSAGYDDQTIEQVYSQAYAEVHPESPMSDIPESSDTSLTAPTSGGSPQKAVLPSGAILFENGWAFVKSRLDLLVILSAPLAVIAIIGYLGSTAMGAMAVFPIVSSLVTLAALVLYILNVGALLFTVVEVPERIVGYREALTWVRSNFWRLVWVYLLTVLVIYGGFLLFVIPGIIVSLYVYFPQYAYAKEGQRGMSALLRSRSLVLGNWWRLLGRLVMLGMILLLIFFVMAFFAGLAMSLAGDSAVLDLLLSIGAQVFGAAASMIGVHAGMELYQNLARVRPAHGTEPTASERFKYTILAWLGLLFAILISSLVIIASMKELRNEARQPVFDEIQNISDEKDREAKLRALQLRQEALK